MKAIKFYYMPESFPCRAVEMAAAAMGVTLEKHYINLTKGESHTEEYLRINPLGKVPVIVDGDFKLTESRAIMAYLVNKYLEPSNTLYPADPEKRAKIDELLYLDIGHFYESVARLYRPCIFGISKVLDPENEKKFLDAFELFNNMIKSNGGKKFVLSDELTIADISFAATLQFPDFFGYDMSRFKELAAYYKRLQESIPNYREINEKAGENTRKFARSKIEES